MHIESTYIVCKEIGSKGMTNLKQEFYSIRDLSDLLRVSVRTVWNIIKRQNLQTLHIGRKVIIPKKEVKKILDEAKK